ncbi:hypothetical protein FRC04_008471 [Tulasnella sp. 424]|nr:hypothetical protein FRC04_008471 [Tulasnella sp. 424]KAG8973951.1 hypothetical protein FRC05_008008 [Tulasnella sp. 425]
MLQRKDKIEHEQPDSEAQAEANKYPGLFETPQPKLDGQPANLAQDEAVPPYQNRDGLSTQAGFESSPNTTKPVFGNEGWKQGTVVAAASSTPAVESKGQLDSDTGNSHDEKAPFKLF